MTPEQVAATKAEADRVAAAKQSFTLDGDQKLGGPFMIVGEGFGEAGVLKVGDTVVKTTKWTDGSIKGMLPAGLTGIPTIGSRRGQWPQATKKG